MSTLAKNDTSAYRFIPKEVNGLTDDELRLVIGKTMNNIHDVDTAHIEDGVLHVELYVDCGRGLYHREHFEVPSGYWLVINRRVPEVVSNGMHRMSRFEAKINGWFSK